jgi:F420-dependent oxidoreductase-like protein
VLLRAFIEPQLGATYGDQLAFALAAERLGFDAFFRSDHFVSPRPGPALPGPTDAWTTLAGLARETSTIRLGTLVSSVTFRQPGILAVQVAQVDEMSGGRVELGLGAGWFEREHEAYGVPFPPNRFDLLEEQLEIITGLWSAPDRYTFHGKHYEVLDSPALPKPVQHPLPVIVGGKGPSRTPALAARFATEFNMPFPVSLDDVAPAFARVDAACEAIGRDPATLRHTLALTIGTVPEMAERIEWAATQGVETFYVQFLDLHDLELLELAGQELIPLAAAL